MGHLITGASNCVRVLFDLAEFSFITDSIRLAFVDVRICWVKRIVAMSFDSTQLTTFGPTAICPQANALKDFS